MPWQDLERFRRGWDGGVVLGEAWLQDGFLGVLLLVGMWLAESPPSTKPKTPNSLHPIPSNPKPTQSTGLVAFKASKAAKAELRGRCPDPEITNNIAVAKNPLTKPWAAQEGTPPSSASGRSRCGGRRGACGGAGFQGRRVLGYMKVRNTCAT